jgi:hypothetical protein
VGTQVQPGGHASESRAGARSIGPPERCLHSTSYPSSWREPYCSERLVAGSDGMAPVAPTAKLLTIQVGWKTSIRKIAPGLDDIGSNLQPESRSYSKIEP